MAAPTVSSSTPSDGDSDVYINKPIDVTFAEALYSTSVAATTVLLEDVGANTLVASEITLPTTTKIRISPIGSLAEDTLYRVKFPGTDTALGAEYVIKSDTDPDSNALATTILIQFRTGSTAFLEDTKTDKDATDLSLEGDLNLPIHVKALGDLAVATTIPKNNKCDIATGANFIVTFNQRLSSGLFTQDWLDIDVFPLLDSTEFLSDGTSLGTGHIPGWTVSQSNTGDSDSLIVNFNQNLPFNAGVHARINPNVTAEDGGEFGPNTYLYAYTTDRYPKHCGAHVMHRELAAISDELKDDYICATLFSATIQFENIFTTSASSYLSSRWVLNKAIVLILDDKELEKAVVAGTRRQLGDMSVSVDPIIGRMAVKHKRSQDELDRISKTINKGFVKSYTLEAQAGLNRTSRMWVGVNGHLVNARFAYWQPNLPASNLQLSREAKVPPSLYFP